MPFSLTSQRFYSVSCICGLIAASLAEFGHCFGPPWLEHDVIVILTLIIAIPTYFLSLHYCFSDGSFPSIRMFVASLVLLASLVTAYFWLHLNYTYPLPDHCHREIGGWEMTEAAKAHLARNNGMSNEELLADMGSKVEDVFTRNSLTAMRFILTGDWLLVFTCLSIVLAMATARAGATAVAPFPLTESERIQLSSMLLPSRGSADNADDHEKLHRIIGRAKKSGGSEPQFNIVFIHGVDGHWRKTWQPRGEQDGCWLDWMADDFPNAAVWSLHYNAATLHWKGETLRLGNRATNVTHLLDAERIFKLPTFMVVHSFGGLVLKKLWQYSFDDKRKDIRASIQGVVFLATPHLGSCIANYAQLIFVRALLQPSVTTSDLTKDAPDLIDLSHWYRNHPIKKNIVFFEGKPMFGRLFIVDEVSSDPAIKGVRPIQVVEDHVSICKPELCTNALVSRVRQEIEATMKMKMTK